MSEMVERVGEALRKECQAIFGSTWNYDNAWRLARAAIEAMRDPTEAMIDTASNVDDGSGDFSVGMTASRAVWHAMIDAALKEGGQ